MTVELSRDETYTSSVSPRPTLLTFLIAGVRGGYTRYTVEQGDEAAARLADRFATLCEEILAQHDEQVIEMQGDEALAIFSARSALGTAGFGRAWAEGQATSVEEAVAHALIESGQPAESGVDA